MVGVIGRDGWFGSKVGHFVAKTTLPGLSPVKDGGVRFGLQLG